MHLQRGTDGSGQSACIADSVEQTARIRVPQYRRAGMPVVHVSSTLAVWKAVKEPAILQALALLSSLQGRILEVAKILLPQLHLLLQATPPL